MKFKNFLDRVSKINTQISKFYGNPSSGIHEDGHAGRRLDEVDSRFSQLSTGINRPASLSSG
jgi:hypothetical protein